MKALSIIVVEDHDVLREVTVDFLAARGHDVRGAMDAEELDELMAESPADVVILDVNLPGESGFEICARLRAASERLGIIMLTALGESAHRIQGYDVGADIYLAKPTSQEELAAAVGSLARRASPGWAEGSVAGLTLVGSAGEVRGPSGQVMLTEAEVKMLRGLAMASKRQLEYWQLLELLGMDDDTSAKAALEVRITRLRQKLHQIGAPKPAIRAVRGLGYLLTSGWRVE